MLCNTVTHHCCRALLSEERRAASCVATSDSTVCLSLSRDDFDRMLGSLSDALARRAGIERSRTETNVTSPGGTGANNSTTSSSSVSPKGWLLADSV
jgi:CRP-like cAMP-binding protein